MIAIGEELYNRIIKALEGYIEDVDESCGVTGCLCDLSGPIHSQWISDILVDIKKEVRFVKDECVEGEGEEGRT